MAKPFKHAVPICLALTLLALLGVIVGVAVGNPLPILILLAPAVAYEVYRTQGETTRWASWVMATVLVAEIVFIVAAVEFDLAAFLGEGTRYVAGYEVPLGDVKVLGPAVMAVLAIILFVRTRGVYTKWLAAIIFCAVFGAVYALEPTYFGRLAGIAAEEGLRQAQ